MSSENILIITLFDTILLLGNEKSSKKEGLSPVTTRWGILHNIIQILKVQQKRLIVALFWSMYGVLFISTVLTNQVVEQRDTSIYRQNKPRY